MTKKSPFLEGPNRLRKNLKFKWALTKKITKLTVWMKEKAYLLMITEIRFLTRVWNQTNQLKIKSPKILEQVISVNKKVINVKNKILNLIMIWLLTTKKLMISNYRIQLCVAEQVRLSGGVRVWDKIKTVYKMNHRKNSPPNLTCRTWDPNHQIYTKLKVRMIPKMLVIDVQVVITGFCQPMIFGFAVYAKYINYVQIVTGNR